MKEIKAYDGNAYSNLYFYILRSDYMKKYGGKKIFTVDDMERACNSINGQRIKSIVNNTIESLGIADYVTNWSLPKAYKALVRKFNVGRYKDEEDIIRVVNSSVMTVLVIIKLCVNHVFNGFHNTFVNEDDEEFKRSLNTLISGNTLSIITGYQDFPEFVKDPDVKKRIEKALKICDNMLHIKVRAKVMSGFFVFNVDLTYLFEQRELEEQWLDPVENDGLDPLDIASWLDKLPRADV